MTNRKTLPPILDVDKERRLLGSLLRWSGTMLDVVGLVRLESFSHPAHRAIWSAMTSLFESSRPIDAASVAEELFTSANRARAAGQVGVQTIEDIGGYQYLADLLALEPTGGNAVYYAAQVKEAHLLRELGHAAAEIADLAANPTGQAEEMLAKAEKRILTIADIGSSGEAVHVSVALDEAMRRIDSRSEVARSGSTHLPGVPSGCRDLDKKTAGFQNSELIILAARPSCGKTALSLAFARNALDRVPVFLVSLEQSRVELAERLIAAESRINSHKIRSGLLSSHDGAGIVRATDLLRQFPLYIDDRPNQTMLRIGANARRLRMQHNIGLVVIDYLQLIEPENRREPRHEQVAGISRRLKLLARELKVPVIALAQLNRQSENRASERPKLSDLRESGSIEADADTVLLLHRPDLTSPLLQVIVAKQRNGPVGTLTLYFRTETQTFEDYQDEGDPQW